MKAAPSGAFRRSFNFKAHRMTTLKSPMAQALEPPTDPECASADPIVKTAMRLPSTLRARLKAHAALNFKSLNALYVSVLADFLAHGLTVPRQDWPRPQALGAKDSAWCQAPLHLPASQEKALTAAAETAQVSLASLYYTAMSEYADAAPWVGAALREKESTSTQR